MPKAAREKLPSSPQIASIILAGGQGTRLHPLTEARCKPAVYFAGRYRLVDIPISNSLHSGIDQIYIILQHLPKSVESHIQSAYSMNRFPNSEIKILTSSAQSSYEKQWYHGTADAVRKNIQILKNTPAEYFLILSGDQLYQMDYSEMLFFAKKEDADLVIATLPVDRKETHRLGLLKIDESRKIVDFIEKPTDPQILENFALPKKPEEQEAKYLGSMGIYIFKKQALIDLLKEEGDDFGKNLIPLQIKKGKTSAFIYEGYWEDIGTIQSYYEANIALTMDGKNCLNIYDVTRPIFTIPRYLPQPKISNTFVHKSLISPGSIIEAQTIENSIIGPQSYIKKGTTISHSIITGNHHPQSSSCTIGENCHIIKAIIDENVSIGNNVTLINKKNLEHDDVSDRIFIRNGIIIVTSGTKIPNGFTL